MKPSATRRGACVLAALAMGAAPARAQPADNAAPKTESIPISTLVGFESIRLPQSEKLGLVGTSVLFQFADSWSFGPAVYGAATGERGGFFVGGVELQHRTVLAQNLSLAAGLPDAQQLLLVEKGRNGTLSTREVLPVRFSLLEAVAQA